MTVSLELDRGAARGIASRFVPTGETGIAIAGWGIAVDAVVSDFLAGAAERLVVEGHERGGELLFVEGQGVGHAPRVLGRDARPHPRLGAARVRPLPPWPGRPRWRATRATRCCSLPELVELHEWISLPARKARVAAIALNTRALSEDAARAAIARGGGRDRPRGRRPGALRRRPAPRRGSRIPRISDSPPQAVVRSADECPAARRTSATERAP